MTSAFSTASFAHAVGERIAVFGDIEPVHRARQVQVTVGIETGDKLLRVVLEIVFDLEFVLEPRPTQLLGRQAAAVELGIPFVGGAVGYQPEFTRQ